jgi:putative oxidoreductase
MIAKRAAGTEFPMRALLASVFIGVGIRKLIHRSEYREYMKEHGLTSETMPILYTAGITELCIGAIFLGKKYQRVSAAGLILFLIPTTFIFHPFWKLKGLKREEQWINFMKNVAITGGLLQPLPIDGS